MIETENNYEHTHVPWIFRLLEGSELATSLRKDCESLAPNTIFDNTGDYKR